MKKEVISNRQGIILITLFIIGSTLLIGSGDVAKQDSWIAVILSIFCSTVLYLMFARILSLHPGKDLFDILELVMGKYMGKLISILMIWFAFHLGAIVTRNLSEFTSTLVFSDTPDIVLTLPFFILLIWSVKSGIEVLGRWSEFFIWVVILLIIFISLLSITQMDINRIRPILYNNYMPLLRGTLSSLSFPFGEVVVFLMVFSNISKQKNYYKTYIYGLMIGGLVILIVTVRNLLVLGSEIRSSMYFPSSIAISLIHIGELLQRLEMTSAIALLVCAFVKISICLFAVTKGIAKVMDFDDYKFIVTPVSLLMLTFSTFVYRSTMEMSEWAFHIWPYYSMIFEVIIPFIIYIAVEINRKLSLKNSVDK